MSTGIESLVVEFDESLSNLVEISHCIETKTENKIERSETDARSKVV